jgi:hypothetical protein
MKWFIPFLVIIKHKNKAPSLYFHSQNYLLIVKLTQKKLSVQYN